MAEFITFRRWALKEPGNEAAVQALAELLVGSERAEEALSLLARIPETAETRRIAALARTGADVDGLATAAALATALGAGLLGLGRKKRRPELATAAKDV